MRKLFISLIISIFVILPVFAFILTANAQSPADSMLWGGREAAVRNTTGLGNADPREMTARVINIMLGFIGIIAVIIILSGGFKWMTAVGNEEKVAEAKKLIGAGIIGLIVILAAFGMAQFVISAMYSATGATG